MWIYLIIAASLLVAVTVGCQRTQDSLYLGESPLRVVVPEGNCDPVLVDGIFTSGEWEDAAWFEPNDSITVYFKKKSGYLFFGVNCPDLILGAADIFVSPGGREVYQFHASAQLGERKLNTTSAGAEQPRWIWGFSDRWYANEFRWDAGRAEELGAAGTHTRTEAITAAAFPREGIEFQFRLSRFDAGDLSVRIALYTNSGAVIYPPNTVETDVAGWMTLAMD